MRICRSSGAPNNQGTSSSSLASLERYKQVSLLNPTTHRSPITSIYFQFFTEEKTSSLLSPEGARLLGHAEDLNTEANAALQALLLVSAM